MDLSNIFCLFIVIILVKARKINSEPVEIDPKVSSKQTKNQFRPSDILLSFTFREENVILELKLNEHLLPENHFLSYQKPNGAKVLQISSETTKELCHYQGNVRDKSNSFASISTCAGIRGSFFNGRETYYIDSKINGTKYKHFITRRCDVTHNKNCSISDEDDFTEKLEKSHLQYHRLKREVRAPSNSNKDSHFVELVLVLDKSMFYKLEESFEKAHQFSKDLVNIMNGFYEPLNVFIALKGVVIWNERDEIEMPKNISLVLQNFLTYRQNVLLKDHPNDNAQLITNLKLGGTIVGLGTVGGICSPSQSGAVSLNHDERVQIVAATVAHELGHNLGMTHDDETCQCPDKNGCIMRGTSSHQGHDHWSSCSKISLRETLKSGNGFCLKNKPEKLFLEPSCGNGFVETGEECDCGLKKNCNNKCCNPQTCKFSVNSTCATGSCCDLETCNFKAPDNICREAAGECDLPEFCNGESEFCPNNIFKHSSVECGKGKAYCFDGECKSNDDQCKMIWGKTSYSLVKCYDRLNLRGSEYGNCGLDRFGRYKPCSKGDAMCGTLQCKSSDGQVKLTAGQKLTMRTLFSDGICFGALYTPLTVGMVPNGAKCGIEKVCSKQKCVDIDELKSKCANCNGRGTCNSNGNCYCDKGWAPPFCNMPGDGGSIDSRESTGREWLKFIIMFAWILSSSVIFSLMLFLGIKLYSWYSSTSWKATNTSFKKLPSSSTNVDKKAITVKRLNSVLKAEDFISIPLLNSVESLTSTADIKTNEVKTLNRKYLPKPPPPPVKIVIKADKVPLRAAPPPPKKTSIDSTRNIDSSSPQVPLTSSSSINNSKIKDTIEKFNQLQIQFK